MGIYTNKPALACCAHWRLKLRYKRVCYSVIVVAALFASSLVCSEPRHSTTGSPSETKPKDSELTSEKKVTSVVLPYFPALYLPEIPPVLEDHCQSLRFFESQPSRAFS